MGIVIRWTWIVYSCLLIIRLAHSLDDNYDYDYESDNRESDVALCESYANCYECNASMMNCIWIKEQRCQLRHLNLNEKSSLQSYWYVKPLRCLNEDQTSKDISETFCGKIEEKYKGRLKLYFPNEKEALRSSLFCRWIVNNKRLKSFDISIAKRTQCLLGIEVTHKDKHNDFYIIESLINETFILSNTDNDHIQKITIYYYTNQTNNEMNNSSIDPLSIEIQFTTFGLFSTIAVYISIAFGGVFFIIAMIILGFCFRKLKERQNANRANNHDDTKYSTSKKYSTNMIVLNDNCPICYEKISIEKERILLKCNHVYCDTCLKEWIRKNAIENCYCPICKCNFRNETKISNENRELMPQVTTM